MLETVFVVARRQADGRLPEPADVLAGQVHQNQTGADAALATLGLTGDYEVFEAKMEITSPVLRPAAFELAVRLLEAEGLHIDNRSALRETLALDAVLSTRLNAASLTGMMPVITEDHLLSHIANYFTEQEWVRRDGPPGEFKAFRALMVERLQLHGWARLKPL